MANHYLLNQSISGGNYHMPFWNLMQTMLLAGWTKVKDSDGTTYSSSGTQITTAAQVGADGAWFVMRDPAGVREICIQHDKNASTSGAQYYWRIKYSKSARFTGGSPAAKQVPSATDEVIIFGAGTDAAPTYQFFDTSATCTNHVFCGDASLGYSFYTLCMDAASTGTHAIFMMDYVVGTSAEDDDPVSFLTESTGSLFSNHKNTWVDFYSTSQSGLGAWLGSSTYGDRKWASVGYSLWNATIYPGSGGASTQSGKDSAPAPILLSRYSGPSNPQGCKGLSTLLRYPATNQSNLYTYSSTTGTSKDWVYINTFLLLWPDPATAPLNTPGNVTCDPAIDPAALDMFDLGCFGKVEPIYIASPPLRNPIRHYHLAALDNNGVVQKWIDTAINMVNAPTVIAGYAVTEPKVLGEY